MATTPTISLQMPPDSIPSPPRAPDVHGHEIEDDVKRGDGSSSYLSEQNVADMDSTLHLHWDATMKSLGFMTMWYLKVAVLMISWDASCDDLHTGEEVCHKPPYLGLCLTGSRCKTLDASSVTNTSSTSLRLSSLTTQTKIPKSTSTTRCRPL